MDEEELQFVFCKECSIQAESDCIYPAKNIILDETGDTIYIRLGCITKVCKYCGEDENISFEDHICYSCNSKLELSEKECGRLGVLLPTIIQSEMLVDLPYESRYECSVGFACSDCKWRMLLPCSHTCCIECFCHIMKNNALTMNDIIYMPSDKCNHVRCFECDYLLPEDYLRLGGTTSWEIYKERIVSQNDRIILYRCPLPNCGGLIYGLASAEKQKIVLCPFCNRYICRHCNEEAYGGRCPSAQIADISKTIRRCPNCNIPITHYFGHGCHHIGLENGCPGCKAKGIIFHWCYYCLKGGSEYPESCKKDHWFCKPTGCDVCSPCPKCNKGNTGPPKPCKCP